MSVVFSGLNSGSFISTGNTQILQLRSGVDELWVYNYTQAATQQATGRGVQFYWQRGMAAGTGIEYKKTNSTDALNMVTLSSGGFTLVDNTVNVPSSLVAVSAVSNANPPVVSTADTSNLVNGDIVRLYSITGGSQLNSIDFTIGSVVANTSFTLAFMRQVAAATTGFYAKIPYNPYFYPYTRTISKIARASSLTGAYSASGTYAIVTMTVTHAWTVGQKIRFNIPTVNATAFGMPNLNNVEATIVFINQADADGVTNTITVDVDISSLGTFAWPTTGLGAFTPAQVVPVGENTAQAISSNVNQLGDSMINQGYIGIALAGGAQSPAGSSGDVIYWVAGKSFNQ